MINRFSQNLITPCQHCVV